MGIEVTVTRDLPMEPQVFLAAQALLNGELVIFPTETVYGIGADAINDEAIDHLISVKDRPQNKPFPVMVRDMAMAETLVDLGQARALAQDAWPPDARFAGQNVSFGCLHFGGNHRHSLPQSSGGPGVAVDRGHSLGGAKLQSLRRASCEELPRSAPHVQRGGHRVPHLPDRIHSGHSNDRPQNRTHSLDGLAQRHCVGRDDTRISAPGRRVV